jgi:alkylation response protein AidB-like acyl-CoA dehydrogenase
MAPGGEARPLAATRCPVSHPALTQLSEEERLFRDSVLDFAKKRIAPRAAAMDEAAALDADLIPPLHDLGLMGIEIPAQYGGSEASFFSAILAVEALAVVDPSVSVLVDVQNTLVANALLRWATPAQKERYLTLLAREWVGSYALSEAGSGSDAFALTCGAQLRGDKWILNGRKLWITNAAEASLYLVLATVDKTKGYKGITAFLVERSFPGFSLGKKEHKLGIRASSTCELVLEDCEVPAANVLGEVGKGYKIAIETLNEGRIGIGAQMIGLSQGAFDYAMRYVNERKQFGQPIGNFQGLQFQRDRGCPPHGLQRRPPQGRRPALRQGGRHGQALRLRGGRALRLPLPGVPRRRRLHQGLPPGEALPRRQDRQDLRRDEQHAAQHHRQDRAGGVRREGVAAAAFVAQRASVARAAEALRVSGVSAP